MPNPLVSICIPSLGREGELARLVELIPRTAQYDPHEIIVRYDDWPPRRRGCATVLRECVEASAGEFCAFLGNDCVPLPGFLGIAMECMKKSFPEMDGLVSFRDELWHGLLATHWLASKRLLPLLGGNFFHTGYKHVGCDNELTERCRAMGKYVYCADSRILHQPRDDNVHKIAWDSESVAADRALLSARAKEFGFTLSV